MENIKIVNTVLSEMENKNWEKAESYLTEDFKFSGAVAEPLGRKEWVGVQKALQTGIPDLKFNLGHTVAKDKNKVTAKLKLTGTHTSELPSPMPGMKAIPTTGKKLALPEEEVEFTFEGSKISGLYVKPVAHGGMKGIIEQLAGTAAENSRM